MFRLQTIVYVLAIFYPAHAIGQQMADPEFRSVVQKPAFVNHHPTVLFDEAHHNFHKASGRYKPFVELVVSDGLNLQSNHEPLTCCSLQCADILVISNAMGAENMVSPDASNHAFTEIECDEIAQWVRCGGSLLLIADHPPFGDATQLLAEKLGVHMSGSVALDPVHNDGGPSSIVFSRDHDLLEAHPITNGRNEQERLNRVITFTGQSVKGPPGSTSILALSDDAVDVKRSDGDETTTSAAGRAQGIAFEFGRGRVVVLGEAGHLTSQIHRDENGEIVSRFGMSRTDTDNRQFALNIMRWLGRALN